MVKESKLLIKKALAVGESKTQFKNLLDGLREEFEPEGFYENLLVDKLAVDYWRLKKLFLYEKEHIFEGTEISGLIYNNAATQFVSYQKSIEKSIEKGICELKKIKKDKKPFGL